MNHTRTVSILLAFPLLTAGCINGTSSDQNPQSALPSVAEPTAPDNPLPAIFNTFPFEENGPFEVPSRKDVCIARDRLRKFTANTPTPPQMHGAIILEGTLFEVHSLPNQKEEMSVKVGNILFGDDGHLPTQISVISPMERFGGLPIAIGEKYRVFVFPLNGQYYSWAATGSAPIDSAFRGFYECNDKQKPIPATKP